MQTRVYAGSGVCKAESGFGPGVPAGVRTINKCDVSGSEAIVALGFWSRLEKCPIIVHSARSGIQSRTEWRQARPLCAASGPLAGPTKPQLSIGVAGGRLGSLAEVDRNRVGDIGWVLHEDRDDSLGFGRSKPATTKAKLEEEGSRGAGEGAPASEFGKPPHLLQHLHHFHSGSHAQILEVVNASHMPPAAAGRRATPAMK
jgi:hypothetical protein